ncbi:uncharacterized protein LOC128677282 [Plodia interpunctella]|uniref:uncharacterized protein LOC128677282 n=1 Tax=Plodia interpunctella TaxID=58824 RepID=UPI0023681C28|nr:uncharacterized protein LOC128677282 [Plodia interpunctella]
MCRFYFLFSFLCILSYCKTEISLEEKDRLLNSFIEFLNNLPNHQYEYEDGILLSTQDAGENHYKIEAKLKEKDSQKYSRCTCTLKLQENKVLVQDDVFHCENYPPKETVSSEIESEGTPPASDPSDLQAASEDVAAPRVDHKPVELDNEIRPNTEATSGEQFVAIPREEPIRRHSAACIGCGSHVDPEAPGVVDLAAVGVKQLDRHEPNVKHSLNKVVEVERQVQIVNGVRYILTMLVDFNNCTSSEDTLCTFTKPCKVSILEKPWIKLPNGAKYRAIVSNNCTDTWLFGDNGEVVSEGTHDDGKTDDSMEPTPDYDKIANTGSADDILKAIYNKDLQSQQNQDVLTEQQIKELEEQIIPYNKFQTSPESVISVTESSDHSDVSKYNPEVESVKQYSETSNTETRDEAVNTLSEEKKKTIDDLINFFNFAGYTTREKRKASRNRRSYSNDIEVMTLLKKYKKVKESIKNAKFIYYVASCMVDYLNEVYFGKEKVQLQEVIAAEEEFDNDHHFIYIQARVVKLQKDSNKEQTNQICNGVIDGTNTDDPEVLNAFCNYDSGKKTTLNTAVPISVDDKVLQHLMNIALKQMESESSNTNAMKVSKIISASTQRGSGILTKVSAILVFSNCSKDIPLKERNNCVELEDLGSKLCDIEIFQRDWLKASKVTQNCIETQIDQTFSSTKKNITSNHTNDKRVIEITNQALSYLETQSNRINRQKILGIKSVSTQLIAGLLTSIDFLVGYTNCENGADVVIDNCSLLLNETLRYCTVKVWDKPWLVDGREMKVNCNDNYNATNDLDSTSTPHIKKYRPDDDEYDIEMAKEALEKYLQENGIRQAYEVVSVDAVKVGVDEGTAKLDFTIRKLGNTGDKIYPDFVQCHSHIGPDVFDTDIAVDCEFNDEKLDRDGKSGGRIEKDPSSPEYRTLAEKSMHHYLMLSGVKEEHKVVSVDKVSLQVVSGSLTRLDFTISNLEKGDSTKCHAKVWEQSWLHKKEITVNCGTKDHKSRTNRQVLGGAIEKDPNDPKYKDLAEESMQKYLTSVGMSQAHKVISVDKVTCQVVAGSKTVLDFTIKPISEGDLIKCHSEVFEQAWLKKKEITVNCEIKDQQSRAKRSLPGGVDERDPNDPKYKTLAEESMQKYLTSSGMTQAHKVISVDKVTYQVVAGSMTRIDFTIKPVGEGDVIKCHSEVWERPWLDLKEITVNCEIKDQQSRAKRSLPGGVDERDPNDPKYKTLAEESMQKYLTSSGMTQAHKVISVDKVTYQVVEGSMTRLDFTIKPVGEGDVIKCHSEVWERPWLDLKEINVNCEIKDQKLRNQRSLPGGIDEQDSHDPKYKVLAEESMQKYLTSSGMTQAHKVISVDKVTYQVVEGSMTRLDFTIKPVGEGDVIKCHSEVWERPWLDLKEINVNCEIKDQKLRNQRSLPGGIDEQDSHDPKYKVLAEESMQKYLTSSGITQAHKVISVDKVTYQVVAGFMTRLDFTIKPVGEGDVIKCHSEVWERPWLDLKEITVNCEIKDQQSRAKRSLPGGVDERDPNDPKYKTLAEESMQKYLTSSGMTQAHKVISVDKVTYQVVAGSMTRLDFTIKPVGEGDVIKCHSEVWERPWLDLKEITVNCEIKDQESRAKRSLPGGVDERDPNDPKYKTLAEESMQKYLTSSGMTQAHKVISVDKVTYQVVAGSMTRLDFTIKPVGEGDVIKCHSEVWERPWLDLKEITVNCEIKDQQSRAKRSLPGGVDERDPNDPKYKTLAEESMQKYLTSSGMTQAHKVISVDKVTYQVVAGSMTRLDFTIKPVGEGDVIKCHSEVWERPWLDLKEITVNCEIKDQQSRAKRSLPGGVDEGDPNDPKYKTLAEESMQKYLTSSGMTQAHKVISVDKVIYQVVAGSMTRLDFTIKPVGEGDVIKCHSEVFEQAWLKKKEITVNCEIKDQKSRTKRHIFGGAIEENASDPKYKLLAEESLHKYMKTSGVTQAHRVVTVDKVIVQVVSGLMTKLNFTITPDVDTNAKDLIKCYAEIWAETWLQKNEINVSCDMMTREKRALNINKHKGGLVEQDPDNPQFLALAKESLEKYQRLQESQSEHVVLEVTKVTAQVVAGTMYRINFTAKRTYCHVSDIKNKLCNKANKNKYLFCFSKIWSRPWLKQKKIDVSCYNEDLLDDEDKIKNHTQAMNKFNRGLIEKRDANKPEYIKMAQLALKKYRKISDSKYGYKVDKIYHVTEQVAAGITTNIDFAALSNNCFNQECSEMMIRLHCQAEIWERPGRYSTKDVMSVLCKQKKDKALNKRNSVTRSKRYSGLDENDIEEELKYYYADLVVQNVNSKNWSNNMFKLISILAIDSSMHMRNILVRMYVEMTETYCLKNEREDLSSCDELPAVNHRLCYARLYPSPDDELIVKHVTVTCNYDDEFEDITGLSIPLLLRASIKYIENDPDVAHKMINIGAPFVIPSLDSRVPIKINFMLATTNCTKDVDITRYRGEVCKVDDLITAKTCNSYIYKTPHSKSIRKIDVQCFKPELARTKRFISMEGNSTSADKEIRTLAELALQQLELESLHRYKQTILEINNYSIKLASRREIHIDFEVAYTSCVKYEWVDDSASCELLEHLPRRQCNAVIYETLWNDNGRDIKVNCTDDETPLEAHVGFINAQSATLLAEEALRHIEAKYPNPRKQKVARIFSLEKQSVAGEHYRLKMEVGLTNCSALSDTENCEMEPIELNKFCRVNVWIRPWIQHSALFRVTCDYQNEEYKSIYEDVQAQHLFFEFLQTYKPDYMDNEKEMEKRYNIFRANVKKMHEFNVKEMGTAKYGVTRFADLTYEEFSAKYLGLKPSKKNENNIPWSQAKIPKLRSVPSSFDWRERGAVTEVKDQGSCGSCWAFSVTGNIEGQWKLSQGELVSLSEQELVDCDKLDDGCNGGLPDNAYRAIEQLGGLELENDYPYEGSDDKCSFNKTKARVFISGAVNITSNETDMAKWLVKNGPISIGINANAMQFYMGGVSHPWKMLCNPKNLDHGVLIVGYGVKDYPLFNKHLPYWTIKNSWGKSWGEQGYYRVYRGDGTCGVNQMASSAVV